MDSHPPLDCQDLLNFCLWYEPLDAGNQRWNQMIICRHCLSKLVMQRYVNNMLQIGTEALIQVKGSTLSTVPRPAYYRSYRILFTRYLIVYRSV